MKRVSFLITMIWLSVFTTVHAQQDSVEVKEAILQTVLEDRAPQNVLASDGTFEHYVVVKWDQMPGDQQYHIFRSTSEMDDTKKEMEVSKRKPILKNAIFDYDVVPGVFYNYWIAASDKNGFMTPFSALDEGHIPAKKIYATPPTLLSDVKDNSILFKWLPISGAKQYRLQVTQVYDYAWTTKEGFQQDQIEMDTTVSGTTFLATQPKEGAQYFYSVQAIDSLAQSYFSEVSGTVYTEQDEMIMYGGMPRDIGIADFEIEKLEDDELSLQLTLSNNDSTDIENLQLYFFSSEDEKWDASDTILDNHAIGFLEEKREKIVRKKIMKNISQQHVGILIYLDNTIIYNEVISFQ